MVVNSRGVPPAFTTPALAAAAWAARVRLQGVISPAVLTTPMKGRAMASSVSPMARRKARCGARSRPSVVARERSGRGLAILLSSCISAPFLIALSLSSGKARRAFLHESSPPLVIISTVKTRLDGALDHGEVAVSLSFEQFDTGEFGGPDGQRRVGADHGRVVLHIRRQFCSREQTIEQAHTQGLVPVKAPASKQDLTRIGWS